MTHVDASVAQRPMSSLREKTKPDAGNLGVIVALTVPLPLPETPLDETMKMYCAPPTRPTAPTSNETNSGDVLVVPVVALV
ncbi:MAG: hypothetical protein U0169_20160 [Polyangiaceae bacterium]